MHSSEKDGEAMVVEVVEGTERAGLERGTRVATATKIPMPEPRKGLVSGAELPDTTAANARCRSATGAVKEATIAASVDRRWTWRLCLQWWGIRTKMP